jgi:hypothetical protein
LFSNYRDLNRERSLPALRLASQVLLDGEKHEQRGAGDDQKSHSERRGGRTSGTGTDD